MDNPGSELRLVAFAEMMLGFASRRLRLYDTSSSSEERTHKTRKNRESAEPQGTQTLNRRNPTDKVTLNTEEP